MASHEKQLPLANRRIAVPESRQLDVLEGLLVRRGADVLRCPLVTIVDAPDPAPIERWLNEFTAKPPSYFVLLTGEGLRRLCGFAMAGNVGEARFKAALAQTTLVSRGPKPARELRRFNLTPQHYAVTPTTDGVIETLGQLDIEGRTIAVQLYGDDPNRKLVDYLRVRGAVVSTVSPYRYAPRLSDESIAELLSELESGAIDVIVFTSKSQIDRLVKVARKVERLQSLQRSLANICVAAVGPVVADLLNEHGIDVHVMPEDRYFMKPLVSELCSRLGQSGG